MQEEIDISQIPDDYGGSSGRAIDDSDDERKVSSPCALILFLRSVSLEVSDTLFDPSFTFLIKAMRVI